jgi:hypothetical protein
LTREFTFAECLEELTHLACSTPTQIGGVFAWTMRAAKYFDDRQPMDID